MNNYELTYLTPITTDATSHFNQIEKIIQESAGTVVVTKKSERINLAYSIKKNAIADITTIEIDVAPDKIKKIEEKIKLDKNILRYILIKKPAVVRKKPKRERDKPKTEGVEYSALAKEIKGVEQNGLKVVKSTKTRLEDINKKLDEIL